MDARCITLEALTRAWEHLEEASDAVTDEEQVRRVEMATAPLLILFNARWDELRATATEQRKPWPMDNDKAVLELRIQEIVGKP